MSDTRGGAIPPGAGARQAVRLDDPSRRTPVAVAVAPDAAGRAAVAARLGIPGIRKLRLDGTLSPVGRLDWRLEAALGATVVQDCVVTLEPVATRLDERVDRTYAAEVGPAPVGEVEMPEDDTIEPLPATLDLHEVMVEALALALPLYPRAPGAELGPTLAAEPGTEPMDDEAARPFAGLRDRLGRDG